MFLSGNVIALPIQGFTQLTCVDSVLRSLNELG